MRMIYTAALSPKENSNGYYARIPDVPGCVTTGRDLPETLTTSKTRSQAACACWKMSASRSPPRVLRRLLRMNPVWYMRSLAWTPSNTA